ncbi:MAG: Stk1 family PASTA domain-containing Ser/Thr kinase [Peptococcaceae bacterium]|jgi:serine/threonine-protein kinase|nr:Stk1 family PASTA domain-containing Ser/Thr kinase [Peptococcaceae bacterium]
MIQLGTILNGRFQVEELLGSGGMSLIFKGTDLQKRRAVAIKMLREQYVGDPVFVARFRREGQAVAGLSHPNIVRIYSVCQEEDIYYLVLELVEGHDLKQILQSRARPFEPREIYATAAQVCDAIYYAHHKNIIHRDIKPHNIIVRNDGQVKVTDFGIARAASEATVTNTGNIMGTVHYLSPEQAKGELADERSDIYSLGVLLYEMVTGKLPYEGESPISVALQKIQQDPVPPSKADITVDVPEALEQVILKAMNRNPQRRYQSALQLKDDLREACFNNRLLYAGEPDIDQQEDTLNGDDLAGILAANGRDKEPGDGQEDDMAASGTKKASGKRKPGRATRVRDEDKGGKTPLVVAILVFIALAIGGLALGKYISDIMYSTPVEVEAPSLIGKTEAAALAQLESLGLSGSVLADRVARENITNGSVAAQYTEPGTPVKPGATIRLTLSKGEATYPAPNLIGETQQNAEIRLNNIGMGIGNVETINDSDTQEGMIIDQVPAPQTPLKTGDKVDIVVSLGPVIQMVRVQSFIGMPVADAQSASRALGIEFGYTNFEFSWTYPKDTIINQSPTPDTQMAEGTPIDIVVSLGPGPG